ncbi:hypothetical protein [Nocardia sp. XZ_19_385]|uniref:hypothetical protein n=1 Tax=Nocardia sp. XZ_19_385 TaxID=2769488 RepID=UPI00188FE23C|nr:hypothetical protein [Nocardia sp. XZ_19_385]
MTSGELELSATRMLSGLTALVRLRPEVPQISPARGTLLRLALEFPDVAPEVIRAIVVSSSADLRPSVAESLNEMAELLARQRIRRIAAAGKVASG